MTHVPLVYSRGLESGLRWARPVGYGLALGVSGVFWAAVLGLAQRL